MASMDCKHGTDCHIKGCYFNHPNRSDCRHDVECHRADCHFNHTIRVCKYGDKCTNKSNSAHTSKFRHTLSAIGAYADDHPSASSKKGDGKNKNMQKWNVQQQPPSPAAARPTPPAQQNAAIIPVGVFWDIENCSVPKNHSAAILIAQIRNYFISSRHNHRELEFLIACDISRLRKGISEDVNRSGGVTLAHVDGSSKNAADEKIRDAMKKFVDTHSASYTPVLVLISGDIDFVNDLRAYQMRLGCKVILLHAPKCSEQFKIGWTELHAWERFCSPPAPPQGQGALQNKQQPQQQKGNGSSQSVPGSSQKQKPPAGPPNQGGGQKQRIDSDTSSTHSNETSGPNKKNERKQQLSVGNISSGINNLNIQPMVGPGKAGAATPLAVVNGPNPPKLPKFILVVMGLPGKMDYMVLREGLQQHANRVGGKVKYVKNGQGYIGFKTKANAEKALELFNGMEVYGKTLNVRYTSKIPFENLLDKKLKGAAPPEDFVMVQATAAATTPNKEAQNASGGGITDFFNDPAFVGKMAGAMIREMTQRQDGAGNKGIGGGATATTNKKEQDSCSIQ